MTRKLVIIMGACLLGFAISHVVNQVAPNPSEPPAMSCTVSNIGLDKLKGRGQGYGYLRITGRLSNNCDQATGVQLKVTVYDKADNILRADDGWPASISNIPAHSDYPFEWLIEAPGFSRFTVNVIGVKTWGSQ